MLRALPNAAWRSARRQPAKALTTSAALLFVMGVVSSCAAGYTAAPPVESCDEALYNPMDLRVAKIASVTRVTGAEFLELTAQCTRGATVAIDPPTLATIAQSIVAKDKKYVVIELLPHLAAGGPTTGTLTVASPEGVFSVVLEYGSSSG